MWPAGCFFAAHIIAHGLLLSRGLLQTWYELVVRDGTEVINKGINLAEYSLWLSLFSCIFAALAGNILFLFIHKVSIAQQSWFRTANKVRRPDSAP